MTETRAVINVDINTAGAAAELRRLQSQLNAFQSTLSSSNRVQSQAAKNLSLQLREAVNATQMFSAETVRMRTSAGRLDDALSKGKGSISQYFNSFRKGSTEAAQVMSLAHARASALQTQFVATGAAAGGYREALAIRPLSAFNATATVSAEKLGIQRAMLTQASTQMINFGKNTQWAGRQLMVGFTVPLTIFGTIAGKTYMELEKQAISFKKVYGDSFTTPQELQENLDAVKVLSEEYTKFGIAASKTMELAAQAAAMGAQGATLTDAITESTKLATLGQMEQTEALETTIALQNAFGLSGEKLAKSVNFLNMVENQTVLTLQDLAEAIPRVSPVIKGLGGTVEDMAAMLAAMKEGGVSAAQGANALKSGLASLINPTGKAVERLKEMGINLETIIRVNRGDLLGTVQAFGKALSTLDEFGRQQALEKVFGKYQYARLGALFNNIVKDGTQASRVLDMASMSAKELNDVAEKELKVISDSPATRMTAAIEKLKLSIAPLGEMFIKFAIPVVELFTRILKIFDGLPDGVKKIGAIGAIIVGVVIPAGTMFLGLLLNLMGTLVKFGHIVGVTFKGLLTGGLSGAIKAVSQSLKYMSLAEIDAAGASMQLGESTLFVNAALKGQISASDGANVAIVRLAESYAVLRAQMQMTAGASPTMFGIGNSAAVAASNAPSRAVPRRLRRNSGGSIPYLSNGNTVPGSGNTDTVPAMLTPGEFVINKKATEKNLPLLYAINDGNTPPGFNRGGQIPGVQYAGVGNLIGRIFGSKPKPPKPLSAYDTPPTEEETARILANWPQRPVRPMAYQSQAVATAGKSKGIYGDLTEKYLPGTNSKVDTLRFMVDKLGFSPAALGLQSHGNFVLGFSKSTNLAMAGKNPTLTRERLLAELVDSNGQVRRGVYSPLEQQMSSYFRNGQAFDHDLFDNIFRGQVALSKEPISNKRFEKISRNALREYLRARDYSGPDSRSFIKDILSKDTVRGNASKTAILSSLTARGIPYETNGKDVIATIDGVRYNFGSVAGREMGSLGRPEGIRPYGDLEMSPGDERVHANKGGMIPGVQYFGWNPVAGILNKQRVVQPIPLKVSESGLKLLTNQGILGGIRTRSTKTGSKAAPKVRAEAGAPSAVIEIKKQLFPEKVGSFGIDNLLEQVATIADLTDAEERVLKSSKARTIAAAHIEKETKMGGEGIEEKVWKDKNIRFTSSLENDALNDIFGSWKRSEKGRPGIGSAALLDRTAPIDADSLLVADILKGKHPSSPQEYKVLNSWMQNIERSDEFKELSPSNRAKIKLLLAFSDIRLGKKQILGLKDPHGVFTGNVQTLEDIIEQSGISKNKGGMIPGVPGLSKGALFLGMPHSFKSLTRSNEIKETLARTNISAQSGRSLDFPLMQTGSMVSGLGGRSSNIPGINGIYDMSDGRHVIKVHDTLESALAEARSSSLMRNVFGLESPQQEVIRVPHPDTADLVFAVRSKYDEAFAQTTGSFEKESFSKQLIASLIRRDSDLSAENVYGNKVADVGAAIFGMDGSGKPRASMPRIIGEDPISVLEQLDINMLMKSGGGAKKHFAESTADIARSMTESEYVSSMKATISRARLNAEEAGSYLPGISQLEKARYLKTLNNDFDNLDTVDWAEVYKHHIGIYPATKRPPTPASLKKKEEERVLRARQAGHNSPMINGMSFVNGGGMIPGIQQLMAGARVKSKAPIKAKAPTKLPIEPPSELTHSWEASGSNPDLDFSPAVAYFLRKHVKQTKPSSAEIKFLQKRGIDTNAMEMESLAENWNPKKGTARDILDTAYELNMEEGIPLIAGALKRGATDEELVASILASQSWHTYPQEELSKVISRLSSSQLNDLANGLTRLPENHQLRSLISGVLPEVKALMKEASTAYRDPDLERAFFALSSMKNQGGMIPGIQQLMAGAKVLPFLGKLEKIKQADNRMAYVKEQGLDDILQMGFNDTKTSSPSSFLSEMFARWERIPSRPSLKEDKRIARKTGKLKYPMTPQDEYLADMILSMSRFDDYAPDVFKPITVGRGTVYDGHTRIQAQLVRGLIEKDGREIASMSKDDLLQAIESVKRRSLAGEIDDSNILSIAKQQRVLTQEASRGEIEGMSPRTHPKDREHMLSMFNMEGRALVAGVHDREISELVSAGRAANFRGYGDTDDEILRALGFVGLGIGENPRYYYNPTHDYASRKGYVANTSSRIIRRLVDEGKILPLQRNIGGIIPGMQYAIGGVVNQDRPFYGKYDQLTKALYSKWVGAQSSEIAAIKTGVGSDPAMAMAYGKGFRRSKEAMDLERSLFIRNNDLPKIGDEIELGNLSSFAAGGKDTVKFLHNSDLQKNAEFKGNQLLGQAQKSLWEAAKRRRRILAGKIIPADRSYNMPYMKPGDVPGPRQGVQGLLDDLDQQIKTDRASVKEYKAVVRDYKDHAPVIYKMHTPKGTPMANIDDIVSAENQTLWSGAGKSMAQVSEGERILHQATASVMGISTRKLSNGREATVIELRLNPSSAQYPQFRADGGQIFESGPSKKIVPGVGNTDTVPAMLTPGEFVINKKATSQNMALLHSINSGTIKRYATGDIVTSSDLSTRRQVWHVENADGTQKTFDNERDANRYSKKTIKAMRRAQGRPAGEGEPDRRMGGAGRMGISMGLGAVSGAISMAPIIPGIGENVGLSNALGGAGMAMGLLSVLPMLPPPLMAIVTAGALVGGSLMILRKNLDESARQAAKFGSEVGGSANRMEKISDATGYKFAKDRSPLVSFKFTKEEKKAASEFSDYFSSEAGVKFTDELKKMDSKERYEEVSSTIAMAIADGMDKKTAKAYGDAIAFYTNDSLLKARITNDISSGKYQSGSSAAISLIEKRQESSNSKLKPIVEAPDSANSYLSDILGTGGMTNIVGEAALSLIPGLKQAHDTIGSIVEDGFQFGDLANMITIPSFVPGFGSGLFSIVEDFKALEKNSETTSAQIGSSLQILKEVENAEALLSEERKKGLITSEEYAVKLAKLQEIETSQYKKAGFALKSASDKDLTAQAIQDQLIVSGMGGDLAGAVSNQTNKDSVANKMFGKNFEQLESPEEKDTVTSVILKTLTGIDDSNAATRLAEIENTYALISQQLVQAAKDGLTPEELDAAVLKFEMSKFMDEVFAGISAGGRGPSEARQRDIAEENLMTVDTLGMDRAQITNGLASFSNKQSAFDIAADLQKLEKFVSLTKELEKFPEITIELLMDEKGSPEDISKRIKKTIKEIDSLKLKKVSIEIKKAMPSPQAFINISKRMGKTIEHAKELYENVAMFTQELDPKGKGKIKTKDIDVNIISRIFDKEVNAQDMLDTIQSVFPDNLDPMFIPLVLAIQNPEVLAALAAGGPTAKGIQTALANGETSYQVPAITVGGFTVEKAKIYELIQPPESDIDPGLSGGSSSSGGGGEKSIMQQLKKEFNDLKKVHNSMQQFINSKKGQFKGIMAGPFGPEFIEYLKSQGEQGLKILNGGLEKIKAVYKEYKKVQTQNAINFAQTLPASLNRQRKNLAIQTNFENRLDNAGFDKEQSQSFIEGMGGPEGIRNYLNAKKKDEGDRSKEEQELVVSINQSIKQGGPAAKQLSVDQINKEAGISLDDMDKEIKNMNKLTALGYTQEEAEQIANLGDVSNLSAGQIKELGDSVKAYNLAVLASDPEALAQMKRDNAAEIRDIQREIEEINTIRPLEDQVEIQQKIIDGQEKIVRGKQQEIDVIGRTIELKQRELEPLDDQIEKLQELSDKTSEAYDNQIEALDQIYKREDNIAKLKQGQLGVAQALSRGDVAGAAQGALGMSQEIAQQSREEARSALEAQKEAATKNIQDQILAIEKQKKNINQDIKNLQMQQRVIQDDIYRIQSTLILPAENEIYRLQGLINVEADRLAGKYKNAAEEMANLVARLKEATALKATLEGAPSVSNVNAAAPTPEGYVTNYGPGTERGGVTQAGVDMVRANDANRGIQISDEIIADYIIADPYSTTLEEFAARYGYAMGGRVGYKGSTEPPPRMMNYGGMMKKYAYGSMVPGVGMTDKVPALLTPGEFVIRKSVVESYGPMLSNLNSQVFPKMNMTSAMPSTQGNENEGTVYNVSVALNGSNLDPNDVANAVMQKIKMSESRNIRSNNIRG